MNKKDLATALITAVLTGIVGLVFQYIDPPKLLTEIWQRMFVNIWFVWLAAAAFGLFWLARFLINLRREMAARISVDDNLSERINNLDRRVIQDIRHISDNLIAQVDERLKREARERSDGINSLSRMLNDMTGRVGDVDVRLSKRIEKIEKVLPPPLMQKLSEK